MRSCTVELFKFPELSDAAKASALDACRHFNVEHNDWFEFTFDDAKRIGAIMGIEITDILFTGFWSQGDGACFEGHYRYAKGSQRAIREYAPQDTELHRIADELARLQRPHFYRATAGIKHRDRYCHEYSAHVDVYLPDGDAGAELAENITEALRDLMRWIYRTLEKEYEYQTSDESVRESIEANEYEFTARGTFH